MRYPFTYRVVTECSSNEEAKIDDRGRQVLVETNNFLTARRECIEWAAYDDIQVQVLGAHGQVKFVCDGASEAFDRYPKTAEMA